MGSSVPTKNLLRLNWLLIAIFSSIVFLFLLLLLEGKLIHKFLISLTTAIAISLIAFSNVGIILLLSRKIPVESLNFKWKRYALTYLVSAIIYMILFPVFDYVSEDRARYLTLTHLGIFLLGSVVVNTIILVLHDFVLLQTFKSKTALELSALKAAHAEAANLLLKQQIHPHFLFNALNTLKSLYRNEVSSGDMYVVHLANFLRVSIQGRSRSISRVSEELSHMMDYLEMQKIRFGKALICKVEIPNNIVDAYFLPSFSLQPLIENAIKHNNFTEEEPLKIELFCKEMRLIIRNNMQEKNWKEESSSYGLTNLSERYQLLSGDEVIIRRDHGMFSVSILLLDQTTAI